LVPGKRILIILGDGGFQHLSRLIKFCLILGCNQRMPEYGGDQRLIPSSANSNYLERKMQAQGKIVQCIGAVVDVEFPRNQMPKVYDALKMEGSALTLEVQQQLGDGIVRTIALGSSDGLRRGIDRVQHRSSHHRARWQGHSGPHHGRVGYAHRRTWSCQPRTHRFHSP